MSNQGLPGGPGLSGPSAGVSVSSGTGGKGPREKPFAITKEEVHAAWVRVRKAKGAAGADGVTIAEFEGNLKGNLYRIWNRMSSGTYFPPPVRAVEIPKTNGGVRILGDRDGGGIVPRPPVMIWVLLLLRILSTR